MPVLSLTYAILLSKKLVLRQFVWVRNNTLSFGEGWGEAILQHFFNWLLLYRTFNNSTQTFFRRTKKLIKPKTTNRHKTH
jgi:hypothetical protein